MRSRILIFIMAGTASILGTETSAQRLPSHQFVVTAENYQIDLGSWAKAEGLAVSWDVAEYRSGDQANSFQRRLLDSFNNGTITLSRPASSESELVREWLAELAQSHEPSSLNITLIDNSGQPVISWEIEGVLPLNWTISASPSAVATETLVIAHEGFLAERSRSRCSTSSLE